MASIHATTGVANYGAYAASKHGVLGLTRVAAKENGHREVRVNAVAPGPIYTGMMQAHWDRVGRPSDAPFDDPIAFRRQGTPEEVAKVVVFLLGPESSFSGGQSLSSITLPYVEILSTPVDCDPNVALDIYARAIWILMNILAP
ncbi:Short-chain dehydrogenase/reductase aba4 [Talaromyces marneffei ATCC 18224]|uniref:uncharacterized protein n=1 Tax=Talaromyces marneffei TaxID=37727 RepID=UPI0012A9C5E0|nr:uncharacterized protein EYB26_001077 [Talaromyces marneffei]KAE8556558.1 hypothetical protein EYB25_001259 [Talaromyces marneffei]QGA13427.1 hypothetical protein EYB26_001077 [Talaromyces marneffei]